MVRMRLHFALFVSARQADANLEALAEESENEDAAKAINNSNIENADVEETDSDSDVSSFPILTPPPPPPHPPPTSS